MTFYHLHHTELRINLMKHRHRISSFVVLIVRNKKLVVNAFICRRRRKFTVGFDCVRTTNDAAEYPHFVYKYSPTM